MGEAESTERQGSSRRWQRMEALFAAALERPEKERAAFLREACGEDETLERAVAQLLEADVHAETEVRDAIGEGSTLLDPSIGHLAGRRIGAYRLLQPLGHGGMGVVYLAERADRQFEKRVALKLMWPGLATGELLRRFRHERQILADLDHPGIARLLDGGSGEDGMPFLVMEHVEGTPIDQHCAGQALGVRARLDLFRDVCDAVEHAHRNLIVHRDLKPANILVTAEGQVKLLDFGIAKLLADGVGDAATSEVVHTAPFMTPQYASPEQVLGRRIGPASDIYSLGVVLYQLLAGTRPYDLAATTPAELERLVCEHDPEPPSAAAARLPAAEQALPPSRLRGDLDAIVAKAMRKERAERYGSVAELGRDIERHLQALPVAARGGTWGYRTAKLLRRRRLPLAAAAAVLALVAAFTWRVVQERERAEQAVELLADLHAVAEPGSASRRAANADARGVYARTDALIDRLRTRPRLQARLLDGAGYLAFKLGRYEQARPYLERALEIERRAGGDDADLARSLDHLAQLLAQTADYEQAIALGREALELRRAMLDPDDPGLAESSSVLANLLVEAEVDLDEAVALYREALALRLRLLGDGHPLVAESHNNLGIVRFDQARYEEAEEHLLTALEIYRAALGDDDHDVAMVTGNLGLLRAEQGRLEEAETLLRRALTLDRRILGDDHTHVATDHDNLALLLQDRGDRAGAAHHYRQALEVRRVRLGPHHPQTLDTVNNLATMSFLDGRYREAAEGFRQAHAGWIEVFGEEHPRVAVAGNNLAIVFQQLGDYAGAERLFEEALRRRRAALGEDHPDVAYSLDSLAVLRYAQGEFAAAEALFRDALRIRDRHAGTGADADAAISRRNLGMALLALGRHDEATPLLREALDDQRAAAAATPTEIALTTALLAQARFAAGAHDAAEALFVEAEAAQRAASPVPESQLATTLVGYGRLLLASGRTAAARTVLEEAVTLRGRTLPAADWRRAEAERALARAGRAS